MSIFFSYIIVVFGLYSIMRSHARKGKPRSFQWGGAWISDLPNQFFKIRWHPNADGIVILRKPYPPYVCSLFLASIRSSPWLIPLSDWYLCQSLLRVDSVKSAQTLGISGFSHCFTHHQNPRSKTRFKF
jgi:hypothetical protein